MIVTVNEFTTAMFNHDYYEQAIKKSEKKIVELKKEERQAMHDIDDEQYYHIEPPMKYETVVQNGVEMRVTIHGGTPSTMEELMAKYDDLRDAVKSKYQAKIRFEKRKIAYCKTKLSECDAIFNSLSKEMQNASVKLFFEHSTYAKVAHEMYTSQSTLYRRLKNEIMTAIEKQ